MVFTVNGLDEFLDGWTGNSFFVAAFTADPGSGGANEVTGGSYARVSVTYGAPQNGTAGAREVAIGATASLNIPAGTTVTHIGLFSALTGGNFLDSQDITDEAFGSAGVLNVTQYDLSVNN